MSVHEAEMGKTSGFPPPYPSQIRSWFRSLGHALT